MVSPGHDSWMTLSLQNYDNRSEQLLKPDILPTWRHASRFRSQEEGDRRPSANIGHSLNLQRKIVSRR